ncbi:leucine-rich repeat domain-containing protein [Allomuricauda sp. R78024]|uniref:leucine-rich repeat domain-containing protein n=1 Tax=Allomuricauda sp. R78024 TaxID=3093867 RepID=UPI0037CC7A53
MKKIKILFLSLFVLAACSKDDDDNGTAKSSAKAITTFVFTAAENDALSADVKAAIDEEKKTVTAELPAGTAVTSLKPSITISEDAKVTPGDKEAKDFSEAVAYTVTAEDGTEVKYTVTVTVGESDAKAITSFQFLQEDNDGLSENIEAEIEEAEKTVLARVPFGTDVTALKPSISISEKAKVSPNDREAKDFSEAVTYTVTAEDETEVTYTVEVEVLKDERQVLIELYNANPNNELRWNLEDEDISNWEGVFVENGRVVELDLSSRFVAFKRKVSTIPASIGDLAKLQGLYLSSCIVQFIPKEIGKLKKLEFLDFYDNELIALPAEMGDLENLKGLDISDNQNLSAIPSELGNLTNLTSLNLKSCSLTATPTWIGRLTNLESLSLGNNTLETIPEEIWNLSKLRNLDLFRTFLTSIPASIGNLENLENLNLANNALTTLPEELWDLTKLRRLYLPSTSLTSISNRIGRLENLRTLHLHSNALTNIPASIGNLTNLEDLWIQANQITTIPKEICNLNIEDFRKDETAECEQ